MALEIFRKLFLNRLKLIYYHSLLQELVYVNKDFK